MEFELRSKAGVLLTITEVSIWLWQDKRRLHDSSEDRTIINDWTRTSRTSLLELGAPDYVRS